LIVTSRNYVSVVQSENGIYVHESKPEEELIQKCKIKWKQDPNYCAHNDIIVALPIFTSTDQNPGLLTCGVYAGSPDCLVRNISLKKENSPLCGNPPGKTDIIIPINFLYHHFSTANFNITVWALTQNAPRVKTLSGSGQKTLSKVALIFRTFTIVSKVIRFENFETFFTFRNTHLPGTMVKATMPI